MTWLDDMYTRDVRPDWSRRRLLGYLAATTTLSTTLPSLVRAAASPTIHMASGGELSVLSDGHLDLPPRKPYDTRIEMSQWQGLFDRYQLDPHINQPDCNITVLRNKDKLILFDIGSGANFMNTTGLLPTQLETVGIDPLDVTDVIFTHAHPDHLWGVLDNFDELLCANATHHIHQFEYDYWMDDKTLSGTAENRKTFVIGAQNRLPRLQEQLQFYNWGDEVVAGVEAIDTHGHTPGHTSFAIHNGDNTVLVAGDALTHIALSFEQPKWLISADLDPVAGAATRQMLLERSYNENLKLLAFHLPYPGLGQVDKTRQGYRFIVE